MSNEEIIKEWRIGHSIKWLTKEYKKKKDKEHRKIGLKEITKMEAQAHVERTVFYYQTALMRGEKNWK